MLNLNLNTYHQLACCSIWLIAANASSSAEQSMRVFAPVQIGSGVFKWQTLAATTNGKEWVINLVDGQLGDFRYDPDRILFQGCPSLLKQGIFIDGFE